MKYRAIDEKDINTLLAANDALTESVENKLKSLLRENNNEIIIDPKDVTEEDTYETTFISWDRHSNTHVNVFLGVKLVNEEIVLLGVDNDEFEVGETPEKIKEVTPGFYDERDLIYILRHISSYANA